MLIKNTARCTRVAFKLELEMSRTHQDTVIFIGIQREYAPSADVVVRFQRGTTLLSTATSEDWIGLFRVGWTSVKDRVTSVLAPKPLPNQIESRVTFAGSKIPSEDGRFYQFCYVTKEGAVRGASAPFQFTRLRKEAVPEPVALDTHQAATGRADHADCEALVQERDKVIEDGRRIVASLEDRVREKTSLLDEADSRLRACVETNAVLQDRLEKEVEKSKHLVASVQEGEERCQATLKQRDDLQGERDELQSELKRTRTEKDGLLAAMDEERERLNRTIASQLEQINALKDDDRARAEEKQTLTLTLHQAREQARALEERFLKEVEAVRKTLEAELERTSFEKQTYVDQLAQVKQENATLEEALRTQTSELVALRNQTQNQVVTHQEELRTEQVHLKALEEQLTEKQVELEKEKQDHFVTQENIVELMGGQFEESVPNNRRDSVERSVYEALQATYESLEMHYQEAQQEQERGARRVAAMETSIQTLENQCDELRVRISQCKKEYEVKAKECLELRRGYAQRAGYGGDAEVAEYQARLKVLEQQVKSMQESHGTLSKELEGREETCQKQYEKIQALEGQLAELKEQRDEELKEQGGQRRDSLRGHPWRSLSSSSRICPICSVEFSLGAPVREFEEHVNSHLHD